MAPEVVGLVEGDGPRLVLEHDGDTITDRIGQAIGGAYELLLPPAVNEPALTDGANQDVEQASVHALLRSQAIEHHVGEPVVIDELGGYIPHPRVGEIATPYRIFLGHQ